MMEMIVDHVVGDFLMDQISAGICENKGGYFLYFFSGQANWVRF